MDWDLTWYADRLNKRPANSGTGAGQKSKESLRKWYPPENNLAADLPISTPCILIDMQGVIGAWYLPRILKESWQVNLSAFWMLNQTWYVLEWNVGSNEEITSITGPASKWCWMAWWSRTFYFQSKQPLGSTQHITCMVSTRAWGNLFESVNSRLPTDFNWDGATTPWSQCHF